jgi:hypothetical protein
MMFKVQMKFRCVDDVCDVDEVDIDDVGDVKLLGEM